jgi:DNA-binding response OmpR family regulator
VTARSGAEALQVLAAIDVSLIVTDERMDDVCGSELAQRVRGGARNCDVPIVLLSGADPAAGGIRRAIALPDVIFVAKPIHGTWLRARVAELVRGERGAAEVLVRSR